MDDFIIVDDEDGYILAKIDRKRTEEYGPTIYKKVQYYHDIRTILRDEFDVEIAESEE